MSVSAENLTNASEQSNSEETNAIYDWILSEVIQEKKVNLERLNEQMSTLA